MLRRWMRQGQQAIYLGSRGSAAALNAHVRGLQQETVRSGSVSSNKVNPFEGFDGEYEGRLLLVRVFRRRCHHGYTAVKCRRCGPSRLSVVLIYIMVVLPLLMGVDFHRTRTLG
jgi:hypothetical protein